MDSQSLRHLASALGVPERTLRRAAAEGLLHGRRVGERRYEITLREEIYLRERWPLLRLIRTGLRTEQNVRLAVLFGSVATGHEVAASDVDLLVILRDVSATAIAGLAQRLTDRVGRDVHIVRLRDAERSPILMADVLAQGRVLVDREQAWSALKLVEEEWQQRAAVEDIPLVDTIPDLKLS